VLVLVLAGAALLEEAGSGADGAQQLCERVRALVPGAPAQLGQGAPRQPRAAPQRALRAPPLLLQLLHLLLQLLQLLLLLLLLLLQLLLQLLHLLLLLLLMLVLVFCLAGALLALADGLGEAARVQKEGAALAAARHAPHAPPRQLPVQHLQAAPCTSKE
jgi:hypothetical protein